MKPYRPNFFISGSIFLLLFSCSPVIQKGFKRQECRISEFPSVFPEDFNQAVYKFNLSAGNKIFTGLGIFKRMKPDSSFRTVFMTETGLKFFEFEFFKDQSPRIHYVMDAFNHRGLLRLLTEDIGMAVFQEIDRKTMKCFQADDASGRTIIKQRKNGRLYLFLDSPGDPPRKIVSRSCLDPLQSIRIEYIHENYPSGFIFEHKTLGLKIELQLTDQ
jgi:hypothetical protein